MSNPDEVIQISLKVTKFQAELAQEIIRTWIDNMDLMPDVDLFLKDLHNKLMEALGRKPKYELKYGGRTN